jgi:hypothetical protein
MGAATGAAINAAAGVVVCDAMGVAIGAGIKKKNDWVFVASLFKIQNRNEIPSPPPFARPLSPWVQQFNGFYRG